MPVSQYFNNYPKRYSQEQSLIEDLLTEAIKIYGADVYYIVRESAIGSTMDLLYGEDPTSHFSKTYKMEMYLSNVDGHNSGGDLLAKFGLQATDGATFVMSRRTFKRWVPENVAIRPREGDLIYFPVSTNLYEIKFVDHETNYYTLGRDSKLPYIYEMRCELFKFGNEKLDTGIPEIDDIAGDEGYVIDMELASGSGNFVPFEMVIQNTVNGIVVSWDSISKILKVKNINGVFSNTGNVTGTTSGANWSISEYDALADSSEYDSSDNRTVQDEADDFIITTENDPMGRP